MNRLLRGAALVLVLVMAGYQDYAMADAVQELNRFVNTQISSEPTKMGKVRLLMVRDDRGKVIKLVEFTHPFAKPRPEPRAWARELNWAPYENVRVRIRIADSPEDWRYTICHPALDTEAC